MTPFEEREIVRIHKQRLKLQKELRKNHWEWMATLTFPEYMTLGIAKTLFHKWCKRLNRIGKIKFGAIAVFQFNRDHNPHIHVLMTSMETSWGKTFDRVSTDWAELIWSFNAKIHTHKERKQDILVGYFTREKNLNLDTSKHFEIEYFRPMVLADLQTKGVSLVKPH